MMIRLTATYVTAIGAVALLADTGCLSVWLRQLHAVPYGDKLVHFLLVGTLALLVNLSLARYLAHRAFAAVLTGSLIVTGLATVEEFSNLLTSFRTFSLGDLVANYLGILLLGVLPLVVVAAWRSTLGSASLWQTGNV